MKCRNNPFQNSSKHGRYAVRISRIIVWILSWVLGSRRMLQKIVFISDHERKAENNFLAHIIWSMSHGPCDMAHKIGMLRSL